MPRFHHSDQRGTHSANAQMLGGALQSRASALRSWTWNTGSEFTEGRASSTTALHSEGLPSCGDIDPRWSASRVRAGENCCMRIAVKIPECISCGGQPFSTRRGVNSAYRKPGE